MNTTIANLSRAGALLLVLAACACTTLDTGSQSPRGGVAIKGLPLDPAVEARLMALDPENISAEDVRNTLSKVPAPRIVLIHGGVFPVHLAMTSFANFLVGMGYPEERVRVAGPSGDWSHNPYLPSSRLAGLIAWSYEQEGLRPMLIGHSQGGIQVIKVLNDLAGTYAKEVRVWNPITDRPEARTTIIDPLTGNERPVVGVSVSFASAVGAGGPSFIFPNNWDVIGRLREIPENVVQFNGYFIGIDWFVVNFGGPGKDRFRPLGKTFVRNVELPAGYLHVSVPVTGHLPSNPEFKAFVDAYRPTSEKPDEAKMLGNYSDNIYYAADNWHAIKKHWALEAQRLVRARRG